MVIREAWNLKLDAEQVKKDKKKVVKNLKKIWKFHNWIVKEKFCSFFLKRSLAHTHTHTKKKRVSNRWHKIVRGWEGRGDGGAAAEAKTEILAPSTKNCRKEREIKVEAKDEAKKTTTPITAIAVYRQIGSSKVVWLLQLFSN